MNKLMKAHSRAQEIFDSENTPFSKAMQIKSIYKKACKNTKKTERNSYC
jgi:hypothetical protein